MPVAPLSTPNVENKKSRVSKAVALAILSPAILTISGCGGRNSADCDSNRSTPQTSDDCGTRRATGYRGGGGGFIGGNSGASNDTGRGGFGGLGRFFSGGG